VEFPFFDRPFTRGREVLEKGSTCGFHEGYRNQIVTFTETTLADPGRGLDRPPLAHRPGRTTAHPRRQCLSDSSHTRGSVLTHSLGPATSVASASLGPTVYARASLGAALQTFSQCLCSYPSCRASLTCQP
jgi:hypothetical protein